MLRCHACGHGFEYRDGMRFCAACAAPVAADCNACGRLWLPGDQFCPFCAAPTGAAIRKGPASAVGGGAFGEADEFRDLALDALARATAVAMAPSPALAKANLDQDDVDSLFADPRARA